MLEKKYDKPKVIAEIGCNHKGEISVAKELIRLAKDSGADVAKFQKRNPRELLSKEEYNAPHPVSFNSYGNSYGEHREYLELSIEQHAELKKFAEEIGITYSTSVWDVTSASEVIELNPDFIKVGSGSNTNFEILKLLRDDYMGEVHISFGMTTNEEEERIINFMEDGMDTTKRLVIYSCVSGYPVDFKDLSLLQINLLYKNYSSRVKEIGFSGHHLGIAADIAAYTLGATWIERHFTKDRTWKGTDHAASLEPSGLSKLIRDLIAVKEALKYKEKEILDIEKPQRDKLKYKTNFFS